ncbi:MAG: DUF1810 domain-containing protein [Actinomycetota bacterium]|nr:DUF1810 domain-containing protein [Actinomycetota bacterium]
MVDSVGAGLARFVEAQDKHGTYDAALRELQAGHKRGHWMWFVFPQLAGLGHSAMARHYAISGTAEARAYLGHAVLGARLRECVAALLALPGGDPVAVLGSIDAMKLRSSMTLFTLTDPDQPAFRAVLDKFFGGRLDSETTSRP